MNKYELVIGCFTIAVAIYAAIVSSYAAWFKDRLNIKIKLSWSFPVGQFAQPTHNIMTTAQNHSINREVIISSYGFYVEGINGQLIFPYMNQYSLHPLPHLLKPGHSISAFIPYNMLREEFHQRNIANDIKIAGFFRDELGNEYKSDPLNFPMNS